MYQLRARLNLARILLLVIIDSDEKETRVSEFPAFANGYLANSTAFDQSHPCFRYVELQESLV
jgi:hypothetical protein